MYARLLRLLAAFLCFTAVSTGCIVNNNNDHEHEPVPGDVSFLWSFASPGSLPGRCADVPDVKRVRITIPGQTLVNGGVYSCNTEGVDGIILRALAPGLYNYAIEALGQTDQVLYSGSGSFTVDGNEQVSATLTPITRQPARGDVSFTWTFARSGSTAGRCADVPNVKRVRLAITGETVDMGSTYPCTSAGVDGITLKSFEPGSYGYSVEALGDTDQVLYSGSGSFTVDGNKQVSVTLQPTSDPPPPPPPAPGDITFLWSFAGSGSTTRRCADVPEVKAVRLAITGETVDLGNSYPCTSAGVDGITLKSFAPGTYSYTLEAVGPSDQSLYTASGSITVDGNKQVSVTLQPTSDPPPPPPPAPGDITFLWTFSNSTSGRCADVPDVKSVRITIPGEVLANNGLFACNNFGVDGIALHDFVPGAYSYTAEALGYDGEVLYKGSGSFTVNGNVRVNITLTPNSTE